jgi:hypothetical protein
MEKDIGLAVLVGLATTSSLYVWKSASFTKTQKTILLICVLIVPLQWVGILAVLAYNKNVENNSSEKILEKNLEDIKIKLDSTISNLTALKEKGILTNEEYKAKVYKVEAEKSEQDLKSSYEYKQLKDLFDSGILTKAEFDSKVKLIKVFFEKEVELNKFLDSEPDVHLPPTEEVFELASNYKDEKNSTFYNFVRAFAYLAVLFFIIAVLKEFLK